MRNALWFWAVAATAFFVTLDTAPRPEAGFQADFEPAIEADTLHLSLLAPALREPAQTL
jgi:hypothetical protein